MVTVRNDLDAAVGAAALRELMDERPELGLLLRGRAFARALH